LKVFKKFFKETHKYAKRAKSRRTVSHRAQTLKCNIHHNVPHTENDQETGLYLLNYINSLSENREITCGPALRKIIAQDILQYMEQIRGIEPTLKNHLMLQTEIALSDSNGKIRPIAMTPLVLDNLGKKTKRDSYSKSMREKKSKRSARGEEKEKEKKKEDSLPEIKTKKKKNPKKSKIPNTTTTKSEKEFLLP